MAEHRYDIQGAIYMLALHRLLRARLGSAYDPTQQLGGAVYFFLRGVNSAGAGCCTGRQGAGQDGIRAGGTQYTPAQTGCSD